MSRVKRGAGLSTSNGNEIEPSEQSDVADDFGERYYVQSRFSPRAEWKTEAQDAILQGALQQASDLAAKYAKGTAIHRVWDSLENEVVWSEGSIDVGLKDEP